MSSNKILTIGILAHVDAGKTSLTEALLFTSGATKERGSVDKGSAITDGLKLEKSRGISIKTSTVDFSWKRTQVNVVDTPGHIDFSAEVDRALSVLDYVVLVVSAKEGVQAHTINLWESIKERNLPCVVFMNKIDRDGADLESVFREVEADLNVSLFALNLGDNGRPDYPCVHALSDLGAIKDSSILEKSLENLADLDETFIHSYLEGNTNNWESNFEKAKGYIDQHLLTPILFGSAKFDLGLTDLLNYLVMCEIENQVHQTDSSSLKVFKIEYHPKFGRMAHLRLYSGEIKNKDLIWSQRLQSEIKLDQVFQTKVGQLTQVGRLEKGEIGMVLSSAPLEAGDVLGRLEYTEAYSDLSESVIGVQAVAKNENDYQGLGEALEYLNIEDPRLDFQWYKDEREFHLKILGPIQTEILQESLLSRFGIDVDFLSPKVIYKETPSDSAEGFVRYWMPKPCWAIMNFLIEPGVLDSGWAFESKVSKNDISNKYQNEVIKAIPWTLKQGIKGWEVSDLKITLLEGTEHNVHSNPGDFLLATPMGLMRGLEAAGTDLLEPMYAFQIKAHQDHLGAVSGDLNQMRAKLDAPEFDGDTFTLTGRVAVAKAMNYSIQFNTSTSGKGRLKLTLDGYEKTEFSEEKVRAYRGVSPLDEAQWILHRRGAFKADER